MRGFCIAASLFLASCGGSPDEATDLSDVGESKPSTVVASTVTSPPSPIAELSSDDRKRVCRAAIADMNGHSPDIVKVRASSGDSVVVRYNRPDDGKAWTNECRFEGDRVIWRTIGAFGGTEPGRWRTHPADETIKFALEGSDVTITTSYPDGSGGSKTYTVN